MLYEVQKHENYSIISLKEDINSNVLSLLKDKLSKEIIQSQNGIVLDLSATKFICSSAIAFLFNMTNEAINTNKQFIVSNINEDVDKLFSITGLKRHLVIITPLDEAVKKISRKK